MNYLNPGLLGAYNSLTDKHLTGYFNNTRIRRHLQKVGLLSRSGRIIPEKEYRYKLIQRAHQRHVRECLAQAIFHKVLDMERLHQIEIKRKLEEFARRERVHKIKVERSNRYDDDNVMMLSPRPPTGPKNSHARHSGLEGDHSESTESPGSSRPNTAPGKMQRPVRLKPLNSTSTPGSLKRNSSRYRQQDSSNDTDHPFSSPIDRDATRHLTLTDFSSSVSPYRLPVINNLVTPVPPLTKRKDKGPKMNGTLRGRRLRPTTAPSTTDNTQDSTVQRASAQSSVSVKMVYFGKSVHLSHDLMDLKDEVKVFQQHCGGENLCVYKGRVKEGEVFQLVSRRHRGFPFSLTFFLNGLQVERLSSCCEFKHRKGSRLGGRHGHFGFISVEGASPCYRCIIAMGLDKKPTPPKRIKEDPLLSTSQESSKEEEKEEEKSKSSQPLEIQTDTKAEENKPKNDYEEDFEADDEGPVEDGNETSPSPTRDEEEEKGKKDENENEVTEKNRDLDSEAEAEDSTKNKVKRSSSVSSGLSDNSSSGEEDEIVGDPEPGDDEVAAEVLEEDVEPERQDSGLTSEKDTNMEETEALESSSVTLPLQTEEESQTLDSFREKSEVEISEDTERVDGEGEKPGDEEAKDQIKAEGEERQETAKSVQEKLAEAILNVSECSSEPEFSDTTTEEDEVASVSRQESSGAKPVSDAADEQRKSKENGDEPTHDVTSVMQNIQQDLQPVVKEQKNSAESERDETEDIEQKEEVAKVENKAREEPEKANTSDNDETEDAEGSRAEDLLVQEPVKETESENTANVEETIDPSIDEPEVAQIKEELEPKEAMAEPQSKETEETAVGDTAGNTDEYISLDVEVESLKPREKDTVNEENRDEGTGDESSAEDKVKEEVNTEGEEAFDNKADGETWKEDINNAEDKNYDVADGVEKGYKGIRADKEEMALEEGEETEEGKIQNDTQKEILEEQIGASKNVEVSEEENKPEDREVDDPVNKESAVEKDAEVEDESKSGDDCKPEEDVKENEPARNDKPEAGGQPEKETVENIEDDTMKNEIESVAEKDAEEDESKSGENDNPEEGVKENKSVKEDEPEDSGQPEKKTESKDVDIDKDSENNANNKAEINAEEREGVSQNDSREEKTEDGVGGDKVEVKEGLEGANVEEFISVQEPLSEDMEARDDVAKEPENTEGNKDEEMVKEELTEANQESSEEQIPANNTEVNEAGTTPEETDAEDKPEEAKYDSRGEKESVMEDENKSRNYLDNDNPVDEVKDDEPKEEAGEIDDKEDEENNTEVVAGEAERDEVEADKLEQEENIDESLKELHPTSEGLQESTAGDKEKPDEVDSNIEEVITAEGEVEKEEETPAKLEEGEATVDEEKTEPDQTEEIDQDTPHEEDVKDQPEDGDNENLLSPEASNEANPDADIKTPVADKESELKGIEVDHECTDKEANTEGGNSQELPAIEENKRDVVNEETKSAGGEVSTSVSTSEESQPAEKLMTLKREERESEFSEDTELLTTPPADQGDLVSNWVNIHQASRYFETFVEPLDDMKSFISQESERKVNGEALDETILSTKESRGDSETSETAKDEQARMSFKPDNEDLEETLLEKLNLEIKPEAQESDGRSSQSKMTTSLSVKNVSEDREVTEANDLVPNTESLFTAGDLQAVDNVISQSSETPVMKFEISQDS